tara:strand:- start:2620 stop:3477 length:858 start_codon:yes stop_codon:yes gene_type:complete
MLTIFKNILTYALLRVEKIFGKKGIVILEYHRISESISPEDVHSIYPEEFEFQIEYLVANGYKIVSLPEVIHLLSNGYNKREKIIALTFDDGHKDNIQYAYPILKKFNVKATMFVLSNYVGKKGWLDEKGNLNIEKVQHGQWWDLLSWDELAEISDHFWIEAHGKSHRQMSTLAKQELREELLDPMLVIKETLNIQSTVFCYPFGDYNNEVVEQTKLLGYAGACSTHKGVNEAYTTDFWKLKRNEVGRGITKMQFKLLLNNSIVFYDKGSLCFNRIKTYLNKPTF